MLCACVLSLSQWVCSVRSISIVLPPRQCPLAREFQLEGEMARGGPPTVYRPPLAQLIVAETEGHPRLSLPNASCASMCLQCADDSRVILRPLNSVSQYA